MDSIHPIELTVQQLLDSPLQSLNLNLTSLYESQLILRKILTKLESTIGEANTNLQPILSINDGRSLAQTYLERLENLELKIGVINELLTKVEDRIILMESKLT